MNELRVGDLTFELRTSTRRRTMQITVDRGGELVFSAPPDCPAERMERFIRQKRFWIYTKLAEKEALRPRAVHKEYRSGEGFPYLGRNYRLLLVSGQDVPVKLEDGRFKMSRAVVHDGRGQMIEWYRAHAQPWLAKRVERWAPRVGVQPSSVTVQDLGYRWGSCGKDARLNFHWKLVLLPPRIIEYVIVHELAHVHEAHHTPEFWQRVERALPDFARKKQWLAEQGARATSI